MSDFRPDIWRLQASFDIQGLVEALRNVDAGVRRRAAAALRAMGATDAIPMLKQAMDQEQDPETRSALVAALAALEMDKDRGGTGELTPDPQAAMQQSEVDALIRQLQHPHPEKVIAAAMKLGDLRDKRAVEPLVVLFNNADIPVKVRLVIAEALLRLESAPVEVALLGALRSPNWRVRRNGAAILGQLRAEWAVDPLKQALKDENDTVRRTARAALKYINTPEARAALGTGELPASKTDTLTRLSRAARPETKSPTPPVTGRPDTPAADGTSAAVPVRTPAHDAPTRPQRPEGLTQTVLPNTTTTEVPAIPAITPPPVTPVTATTTDEAPVVDPAKISWPKHATQEIEDQSKIPTRPLNPSRLEEAEERLKNLDSGKTGSSSSGGSGSTP